MMHGKVNLGERGKGSIKSLLKALKPYKFKIALSFLFIAVSTVLSVYAPQWLSKLTDEIVAGAGTKSIDLKKIADIAIVLIVFYGSNALCNYLANFIMTSVTHKYTHGIRQEITKKTNRVPLSYFDSHLYGDTLSVITNDVDTIGQSMDQAISMMFSSVCMLIGVLVAMFVTAWQMALTVLLIIPLMIIMLLILNMLAMPQFRRNQQTLGEMNGKVEENYTGHNVIKAFNAGARMSADFEKSNNKMRKGVFRGQAIAGFMQPAMTFISYFAYASVCVVGGLLMNNGNAVTFGTITAFLVYVNLFQSPMSQLAQALNNIQMASAAATRVYGFLDEKELSDESNKEYLLLKEGNKIKGDVEFKNVRFGYTPDKIIIPDFSAKIKAGMKVAIVGPTGAGKTTLVNLLMRFYEIDGGDITIDGVSIKDMPRKEIHDIFGMVLQDTWMFEGTVRENLLFSKQGVSDEELEKIMKEAGISHYVHTLPGGLDFYMENETNVSGGQKQLITIARAMAENAPLLILDEATSNVDTRTEEIIQRAMDALTQGRTSFVIAHRLSTIKNADMILVMRDGNIVEQGNHEELIALNGFYANLYNSQFANE
ncbi:MAG: ABC transporter ATP-binding protein/permease [Clostridia bacterium]|nr:ABC transporter ATP-binding protein/permease [Clostridia bacterium]